MWLRYILIILIGGSHNRRVQGFQTPTFAREYVETVLMHPSVQAVLMRPAVQTSYFVVKCAVKGGLILLIKYMLPVLLQVLFRKSFHRIDFFLRIIDFPAGIPSSLLAYMRIFPAEYSVDPRNMPGIRKKIKTGAIILFHYFLVVLLNYYYYVSIRYGSIEKLKKRINYALLILYKKPFLFIALSVGFFILIALSVVFVIMELHLLRADRKEYRKRYDKGLKIIKQEFAKLKKKETDYCLLCASKKHSTDECDKKEEVFRAKADLYACHTGPDFRALYPIKRLILWVLHGQVNHLFLRMTFTKLMQVERPCPYCGFVTDKNGMCDYIYGCASCHMRWNFQHGKNSGDIHTFSSPLHPKDYTLNEYVPPFIAYRAYDDVPDVPMIPFNQLGLLGDPNLWKLEDSNFWNEEN